MRYLLLMVDDGTPVDVRAEPIDTGAPTQWHSEMTARGVTLGGARLRPSREGRTVRRRESETLVVDGPYPELREQVAGLDVIDVADLDEAIEVAAKHPGAGHGPIEIRPLWNGGADFDVEALARI